MEKQQFVTKEEFEEFRAQVQEQHEQTRKLITKQAIAIDERITAIRKQLEGFVSRRPDPTIVRDFWIQRIPRLQEEIKTLQAMVAALKGVTTHV